MLMDHAHTLDRSADETACTTNLWTFNSIARHAPTITSTLQAATENALEKFSPQARLVAVADARELDEPYSPAHQRTRPGLWIFKTTGNRDAVIATDDFSRASDNWFVREVLGCSGALSPHRRHSRSLFAIIEPNSCFVVLFSSLLCRRSRLHARRARRRTRRDSLSKINFGALPMTNRLSRWKRVSIKSADRIDALCQQIGNSYRPRKLSTPAWSLPRL